MCFLAPSMQFYFDSLRYELQNLDLTYEGLATFVRSLAHGMLGNCIFTLWWLQNLIYFSGLNSSMKLKSMLFLPDLQLPVIDHFFPFIISFGAWFCTRALMHKNTSWNSTNFFPKVKVIVSCICGILRLYSFCVFLHSVLTVDSARIRILDTILLCASNGFLNVRVWSKLWNT